MIPSTISFKPPIAEFFLFLISAFCVQLLFAGLFASTTFAQQSRIVRVSRVIDGDTFVIGANEKVRLHGVDTPELNSQDSTARNLAFAAFGTVREMIDGRIVKLTTDVSLPGGRGWVNDIFGRTLAYVFVLNKKGEDSLFIQAELLKKGFARILMYPKKMKYYDLFYNLRNKARRKNLGIWRN